MKILIAVDGSAGSFSAVEFTSRLGLPANCELSLLTVVPAGHSADDSEVDRHAGELLREATQRLKDKDAHLRCCTRHGHAAHAIVAECQEWGADLVVVGSHGHGALHRFLLGSVSQSVLKYAPCSVLIVRSTDAMESGGEASRVGSAAGPLRVLVGFDGSDPAHAAIDLVTQLTSPTGVDVRLVGVLVVIKFFRMDVLQTQSPEWLRHKRELSAELETAAARLEKTALTVSTDVREGEDEGEELLDAANQFGTDLVVVGATGRSAVEQFLLGSVSHRVAHHATSSVLVVREGRSPGEPSHE